MEILTENDIREVTQKVIETFVIPDFMQRGHDASGQWVRSLGFRSEGDKGIITGTDYTKYLIDGRGPNKDQNPEAITNWARWYGQNVFANWIQAKGLGLNPYAVAYKIAREGTKIYRDGGSDFLKILETEEVQRFIIENLSATIKVRVVNILRDDLMNLKNA